MSSSSEISSSSSSSSSSSRYRSDPYVAVPSAGEVVVVEGMDVTIVVVVRLGSKRTSPGETISTRAARCDSSAAGDSRDDDASVESEGWDDKKSEGRWISTLGGSTNESGLR